MEDQEFQISLKLLISPPPPIFHKTQDPESQTHAEGEVAFLGRLSVLGVAGAEVLAEAAVVFLGPELGGV